MPHGLPLFFRSAFLLELITLLIVRLVRIAHRGLRLQHELHGGTLAVTDFNAMGRFFSGVGNINSMVCGQ